MAGTSRRGGPSYIRPVSGGATTRPRRRRRPGAGRTRALWPALLVAVALIAFGVGVWAANGGAPSQQQIVQRYVGDWIRGDTAGMYALLDPRSRAALPRTAFAAALHRAADTSTLERLRPGRGGAQRGHTFLVPMEVRTRSYGTLRAVLRVPVDATGPVPRIRYSTTLLFPGLRAGERLHRHATLAARGTLLADDGTPLAEGPGRTSPIPGVAGEIVGTLGPIPADERSLYAARGYPAGASIGLNGLERIFQRRLAGRIGGTLLAGHRVLATAAAQPGRTVRTTIDPAIEQAAIGALAGSYAGITVMDPRTGAVLALAGVAFSAAQPPGSTMKIVTATAALQAGIATDSTTYPYATQADVGGYILKNADNESCGGTLLNAFATSCNSVFAPLGVQLGARRLVATAQRFGFNSRPVFNGEVPSTIPSAGTIGSATAVGSSAIGQGMVQATTLQMADVGATIADAGRRPIPTLLYHATPRFVQVTSPQVAAAVQRMMLAVVRYGTGTAAQIPGVPVAGKTGTAELANTGNQQNATQETDAWFVGYAPAGAARVVACALFPNAGFGADTAAPVVRQVLEAALAAHH